MLNLFEIIHRKGRFAQRAGFRVAFGVLMKGIATAIVLMSMTTASAAEIRCQDAPGREQNGVFWSWREIEGKRCWFVRAGSAMPPKSAFTWAKEEPIQEDVPAVPDKAKTGPSIQMLRVKPVTPEEMFEVRAKWLKDDR
jgi:hypothetical protein